MGRRFVESAWVGVLACGAVGVAIALAGINTTRNDFYAAGTQAGQMVQPLITATQCANCHGGYDTEHEPYTAWSASMMAQAGRDPIFHACLTIANQDAAFAGNFCLRCHNPAAHLNGYNDPTGGDIPDLGVEAQGVSCSVCHRMTDPVYEDGVSPPEDVGVLAGVAQLPVNDGNGQLVIDPNDRRRGPFRLTMNPHQWLQSPFHRDSALCASCHEVSNPAFTRQPDGTYALNSLDAPHDSGNKYEQFPVERTYSEWLKSDFAEGPIDMGGRFGGNNPLVSTCQDCHMPKGTGTGCDPIFETPVRTDLPKHQFNGANTWVLRAIRTLYDDSITGTTAEAVEASIARAEAMLQAASDVELRAAGNQLTVTVINQTGHKLPTGYPEGRRMWVNVKFLDAGGNLVAERGAYNPMTAELITGDTKVYEMVLGMSPDVAAAAGRPAGPGFHFALNNVRFLDNRIPPRGFNNVEFASVQAEPINYTYPDGQYWDDTVYTVPEGAVRAEVRVYHQTTTKEYIEFLRDANTTNDKGQIAYEQWVLHGKSEPALMDFVISNVASCVQDYNADGDSGTDQDIEAFFACLGGTCCETCASADYNGDGDTGTDQDIEAFFRVLGGGAC
ncbi:MAG TPA: hypothetical protein VD997_07355 [Phycisphaerales bacterium]|nr:hypothetical protein [Phycisphaerales bacterium]